jgi:hypothetical protein
VDALPEEIFIGRISAMELIVGARNKSDQKVIEKFISLYSIKRAIRRDRPRGSRQIEAICEIPRLDTCRCVDRFNSDRERLDAGHQERKTFSTDKTAWVLKGNLLDRYLRI